MGPLLGSVRHPQSERSLLRQVLADKLVRTVFQPIVELDTGVVVAYEALSRGPAGPLETPDRLFAAARRSGQLARLDELCRHTALHAAVSAELAAPLTLFVNVEPEVLDVAPLDELLELARRAPGNFEVVLEITERALAARPAEMLATVERLRADGWKVALDDVGADDLSLAFMALLRPEVVKLDLALVQKRPNAEIARIMSAVNAYAERTGAVVLAEGIENAEHLRVAQALGATLGQGWLFGRPSPGLTEGRQGRVVLPDTPPSHGADVSPFACLPAGATLRHSVKPLLIEVSKHLEREALQLGPTCIVVAAFQQAVHFTQHTARRYLALAEAVGFVAALGEDVPLEPATGVRGAHLDPLDPVIGEWDIVVLSPHFAAALLARDLSDDGVPDMQRTFEFALTYDRDVVMAAAHSLMSRIAAQSPADQVSGRRPGDLPSQPAPR